MPESLARKFRIMADVIQAVGNRSQDLGGVTTLLSTGGILRKTEVESLTILATELGFIRDLDGNLTRTRQGAAFERFVVEMDSRKKEWEHPPLEHTVEIGLCATVPPRWVPTLSAMFGDRLQRTTAGPKMVVEEAAGRVVVVSPFIDVQVLQMCLEQAYAKNVEFVIITSEQKLIREYRSGRNYEREKLAKLIGSRFKRGKVFYLESGQSIAHAKVWSGERSVFVTSANIKSDSLTDNLELGIYTDEPEVVSTVREFLDRVIRMEELTCILEVP